MSLYIFHIVIFTNKLPSFKSYVLFHPLAKSNRFVKCSPKFIAYYLFFGLGAHYKNLDSFTYLVAGRVSPIKPIVPFQ